MSETRGRKPANTMPVEAPQTLSDWTAPAHLSREAKREWKRLVALLEAHNKLNQTDPTLVEVYVINAELLRAALDSVRTNGAVFINNAGNPTANPAASIINAASMRLKTAISDLGLCPATCKTDMVVDGDDDYWEGLI